MFRKTFIVRPSLQLKYLLLSLLVVFLTGIVVYFVFWSTLVNSPGLEQLTSGEVSALQHAYRTSFIWAVLVIAGIVGIESVFMFHRLVGPLYVFQKALKRLSTGDLTTAVHSRKNDELQDLAGQLQSMITNMSTAIEQDRHNIEDIKKLLDEGKTGEAKERLSQITCWYRLD